MQNTSQATKDDQEEEKVELRLKRCEDQQTPSLREDRARGTSDRGGAMKKHTQPKTPSLREGRTRGTSDRGGAMKKRIHFARERRKQATKSETLLWSVLRARQLCGLKFRREHPINGYIVDFACESKKLIIEVDGGYHDQIGEKDIARETYLHGLGWNIIRFAADDVENNVDDVARAIAGHLGCAYSFTKRSRDGSGMKAENTRIFRREPQS